MDTHGYLSMDQLEVICFFTMLSTDGNENFVVKDYQSMVHGYAWILVNGSTGSYLFFYYVIVSYSDV